MVWPFSAEYKPWQYQTFHCTHPRHAKKKGAATDAINSSAPKAEVVDLEHNLYLCSSCLAHQQRASGSKTSPHIFPVDPLRTYIVTDPAPQSKDISHIRRHLKAYGGPSQFPWQLDGCSTLYETFARSAKLHAHKKMLGTRVVDPKTKAIGPYAWQSYDQVYTRCDNFASGLLKLGLSWQQKDTVALYSINRAEWTIGEYASYMQSLVPVPLYDTLGADTAEYIIEQAQIKAVVCDSFKVANLLKIAERCKSLVAIIVMPLQAFDPPQPANAAASWKMGDSAGNARVYGFGDVELLGQQNKVEHHPPQPDDYMTICYTSGTTGMPKGALLSHKNAISNLAAIDFQTNPVGWDKLNPEDSTLSYLPLAHIMERGSQSNFIAHGAHFGYFRGNPLLLIEDVVALQPTFFSGPPRLYVRLYQAITSQIEAAGGVKAKLFNRALQTKKQRYERDGTLTHAFWDRLVMKKIAAAMGGRVRLFVTGSAPISDVVKDFIRLAFSAPMIEGYGLTETSSGCTLAGSDEDRANAHVGIPYPCTELALHSVPELNYKVDDIINGVRQPRGEVMVRGLSIFKGYYKDETKTREAFLNGETPSEQAWFLTGDIGQLLPNGTLRIIDRKKNVFKLSQGEYIAAEKIENIYARSKFLAANFVYGDSLQHSLVGIVVPDEANVRLFLSKAKPELAKASFAEIVRSPIVKQAIMEDLSKYATEGKLNQYEKVKDIHLEHELWTPESGILTPTQKLQRANAKKKYQSEINQMYSIINSQKDAKGAAFIGSKL